MGMDWSQHPFFLCTQHIHRNMVSATGEFDAIDLRYGTYHQAFKASWVVQNKKRDFPPLAFTEITLAIQGLGQ